MCMLPGYKFPNTSMNVLKLTEENCPETMETVAIRTR